MKGWRLTIIVGLALVAAFYGLRAWDPAPLRIARLKTFDVYQRIQPREPVKYPVVVIDLDDESLAKYGQWPWPRTLIAELLEKMAALGVGVIGFDVVFPEPDRTSPAQIAALYDTLDEQARRSLLAMPSNDDVLAATIAKLPVVLGQSTTDRASVDHADRPAANKASYAGVTVRAVDTQLQYADLLLPNPGITRNIEALEQAARGMGVFNIDADVDSIVRNVPLLFRGAGKQIYPTLSVDMLRVATGAQTVLVRWDPQIGIQDLVFQIPNSVTFVIPADEKGRAWLHFARWTQDRKKAVYVSAKDVLDGVLPPKSLAGRWALIGTSAVGLLDIKATPLDNFVPGVDVHAQLLEGILDVVEKTIQVAKGEIAEFTSPFLSRPNYAGGVEAVAIIGVGVLLIVAIPLVGAVWSLLLVVVAIGGMIGTSWYLFTERHQLVDMVYPAVAIFVLYTALTYLNYVREQAQRQQVRTAFSYYLSPALVEQLAQNPDQLKLGGEMRVMSFLFSDIRGFTSISEQFKANPEGLVRLINRFLTPMTDLIMSKGGTIDKYMGDCIMAFWNAPIDDGEHARHACDAALAMLVRNRELNAELKAEAEAESRKFVPINVGIGVNSGECFVGNMGSDQRFDYSVIGDDVNLASRLEGQSKTYGVGIVCGEKTFARVPEHAFLELDLIKVKGKAEAVRIYTLLGDATLAQQPAFRTLRETHDAMLAAYRAQEWDKARALAAQAREAAARLGELYSLDDLYGLYAERIAFYEKNPPGAGWDGVFVAETK